MNHDAIQQQWLELAHRNAVILNKEFSNLTGTQLEYTVHLHKCSIKEVLHNLVMTNDRAIFSVLAVLPILPRRTTMNIYKRGPLGVFLLRYARCKPVKGRIITGGDSRKLISVLNRQHQNLKDIINACLFADVNRRVIPFGLFLKVSAGNMLEYILECQNNHLLMARRILMLQNL